MTARSGGHSQLRQQPPGQHQVENHEQDERNDASHAILRECKFKSQHQRRKIRLGAYSTAFGPRVLIPKSVHAGQNPITPVTKAIPPTTYAITATAPEKM